MQHLNADQKYSEMNADQKYSEMCQQSIHKNISLVVIITNKIVSHHFSLLFIKALNKTFVNV